MFIAVTEAGAAEPLSHAVAAEGAVLPAAPLRCVSVARRGSRQPARQWGRPAIG